MFLGLGAASNFLRTLRSLGSLRTLRSLRMGDVGEVESSEFSEFSEGSVDSEAVVLLLRGWRSFQSGGTKRVPTAAFMAMPNTTAAPRLMQLAAPASVAKSMGITPNTKARAVIMMGRKRMLPARAVPTPARAMPIRRAAIATS